MPNTRLILPVACIAAGALVAAQSSSRQEQPTFRSSIEAVQITAFVTDESGQPVKGLTQDDFEVIENGSPQEITTFAGIDIPLARTDDGVAGESDVRTNDRPGGRVYLIALDDIGEEAALRMRHLLRLFLENNFGPNDTAAVVLTGRGLRDSGQDFTSDKRLLLRAIDRFTGGFSAGDQGPEVRQRNIMGGLRALTESMAKLPGRKSIIFVSSGIGDPDSARNPCGCDAYALMDFRPGPFGSIGSDVDADFHKAMAAATRGNVTIYPIDPRGLTTNLAAAESFDTSELSNRTTLGGLAEITGGFAFTSSNNYQMAFDRLVREQSTYYLIGFNSAYEKRDGRYVRVEVRVKRPGLQVRSLNGYIAPRGQPERARQPGTVLAAVWDAVASPLTTSGVPMRVFAAPFQGRGKEASVTVALEIAASRLNLVQSDGAYRGELEIISVVTDAKKKKWPMMRHRATLALKPATYERINKRALRVVLQLPLPEGRYQIRLSAGGAALAGSVVYDLEVPDFHDDFSMSGLVVTSTSASETLTVTPHKRLEPAFPAPPTTAREFSRDDTVMVFGEVYENRRKAHTVDLTTELRDETGAPLDRRTIKPDPAGAGRAAGVYAYRQRLALDEVKPGRYTIHVEARSSLDQKSLLTRDIPITVR